MNGKAELVLQSIKDKFGIPRDYFLHCSELFNGSTRRKLKLELSLKDVEDMYRCIAMTFRSASFVCCYADKRLIVRDRRDMKFNDDKCFTMYFGDKELIHYCKNISMYHICISVKECDYTFYPDPDENGTMRYFNKRKAKVINQDYNFHYTSSVVNFANNNANHFMLKQDNIIGSKPDLIQLADFMAYSFAKAKCVQIFNNKDFFIEVLDIIKPHTIQFNEP